MGTATAGYRSEDPATRTVLVIDDEPTVPAVPGSILTTSGLMVLTPGKGDLGIELCRENTSEIAATLFDLTMPDLSGEEVLRTTRTIRPGVKPILSSGYNEQETIGLFRGKGLAGCLQKPCQPSQLVDTIRELPG